MGFQELGVSKWMTETLASMKIYEPTSIQSACIPEIFNGRDCIGGAKTGSGKTIAFGLPMIQRCSEDPIGIFGLILTPTRELALQMAEQFAALGSSVNIRVNVIVGGDDMIEQAINIQRKPHFLIATPGRLADHIINSGEDTINGLRRVKYLVLDEADRLLSNGFSKDLGRIFEIIPESSKRQTLLFTATVTDAVRSLKDKNDKAFIHEIESFDKYIIPSTLSLHYIFVPSYVKEAYLHQLLNHTLCHDKVGIIFVNRTTSAELLRRMLRKLEFRVTSLHSEMAQSERVNSIHRFKANAAKILIATDVASRGLDIPNVEFVINYDLPADPDDFVHRVGRTARAGKKGCAVSIVAEKDVSRVLAIEERINDKLQLIDDINDNTLIKQYLQLTSTAKRESLMEMDRENFGEKRLNNKRKREPESTSTSTNSKTKSKSKSKTKSKSKPPS